MQRSSVTFYQNSTPTITGKNREEILSILAGKVKLVIRREGTEKRKISESLKSSVRIL